VICGHEAITFLRGWWVCPVIHASRAPAFLVDFVASYKFVSLSVLIVLCSFCIMIFWF